MLPEISARSQSATVKEKTSKCGKCCHHLKFPSISTNIKRTCSDASFSENYTNVFETCHCTSSKFSFTEKQKAFQHAQDLISKANAEKWKGTQKLEDLRLNFSERKERLRNEQKKFHEFFSEQTKQIIETYNKLEEKEKLRALKQNELEKVQKDLELKKSDLELNRFQIQTRLNYKKFLTDLSHNELELPNLESTLHEWKNLAKRMLNTDQNSGPKLYELQNQLRKADEKRLVEIAGLTEKLAKLETDIINENKKIGDLRSAIDLFKLQ